MRNSKPILLVDDDYGDAMIVNPKILAKRKKKPKNKRDKLSAEAKRRCRLNNGDIRMAKEMGLNPRSLIKNIPIRFSLQNEGLSFILQG